MYIPGAVPFGFGNTSAPTGTSACFKFTSAMGRPLWAKKASSERRAASSVMSSMPNKLAVISRVTSSLVGPSPPVTMRASALVIASPSALLMASPSGTVVWRETRKPMCRSSPPIQAACVFCVVPSRSSLPVLRISIFTAVRFGVDSGIHKREPLNPLPDRPTKAKKRCKPRAESAKPSYDRVRGSHFQPGRVSRFFPRGVLPASAPPSPDLEARSFRFPFSLGESVPAAAGVGALFRSTPLAGGPTGGLNRPHDSWIFCGSSRQINKQCDGTESNHREVKGESIAQVGCEFRWKTTFGACALGW